jgi:hypothetical protein
MSRSSGDGEFSLDRRVFRIDRINSGRTKPFGGEKEWLLQVIVNVGIYYTLTVTAARRSEVDALIAELVKARDRASS